MGLVPDVPDDFKITKKKQILLLSKHMSDCILSC